MPIIWKPTGTLDITTDPTELPEQSGNGSGIASGALTRCRNLRLDRHGVAQLRLGASRLSSMESAAGPELLFETGGDRYIFAGNVIYFNEVAIDSINAWACAAPVFSPVAAAYLTEPTLVTITSATAAARIYYTLDGTTPSESSTYYAAPVPIPAFTMLRAIAIDPRGYLYDSAITSGFYSLWATNYLITDTNENALITETDGDNLITEGP